MNPHAKALAILQKARDTLSARLAERVVEAELDIVEDAEGGTYVSEIEAIYDQIGGRLAHLNAMLANLPPAPPQPTDAAASEVVYADLASSPSASFDVDVNGPAPLLGLPAPAAHEEPEETELTEVLAEIVRATRAGDITGASRVISELFDMKPSQARRGALAFERQLARYPDLGPRLEQLALGIEDANEYRAATLLGECFEFQAIDALLLVRALKERSPFLND